MWGQAINMTVLYGDAKVLLHCIWRC